MHLILKLVDSVDDFLQMEKQTLFLMKKNLEIMHKPLQDYIFVSLLFF